MRLIYIQTGQDIVYYFLHYLAHNIYAIIYPIILWEETKATLRGEIIAYSSWKTKQKEKEEKLQETKIKDLQKEYKRVRTKEAQAQLKIAKKFFKTIEITEN